MVNFKKVLEEYEEKPFVWGKTDCYMLGYSFLSHLFPNNKFVCLEGSYNTKEQALEINNQISWHEELEKAFHVSECETVDAHIIIYPYGGFECVHVQFNGKLYSTIEGKGLVVLHRSALHFMDGYTCYRLEGTK